MNLDLDHWLIKVLRWWFYTDEEWERGVCFLLGPDELARDTGEADVAAA